jgi:uroporphyrinogen decarboxylase
MDFVKIQYEHPFPPFPDIQRPGDWTEMPFHKLDFYQEPLRVVEGLVKAAKAETLVVLTLYSPFMFAGQVAGDRVVEHIRQEPDQVKRGMEIITESLKLFVRECTRLGLDGFYTSTQGGENGRLTVGNDRTLFDACIRPYDLALMEEANRGTRFNILHVCDYHLPYASLAPYTDYPGQVVSAGLELTGGKLSPQEVSRLFGRPFLGGLDRQGVIVTGSQKEIRREVEALLSAAPERFMLGADCTVPGETPWDNLKTAISTAHSLKNGG